MAPTFWAAWASATLLMLASSSICDAVGRAGRLVAVQDEPVLEVEELALHLAIGDGRPRDRGGRGPRRRGRRR